MTSLAHEISTLRQAIASAEEITNDDQVLESIDKQFKSWDDLVALDNGDATRTRLETEIDQCRKVEDESQAEVSDSLASGRRVTNLFELDSWT